MSNATVAVAAKVSKDDIPFNPKVHYKKKVSDWVIDIIIWLLLALVVIAVLYPLWFVIISSFSSPNAVASGAVTFLPKDITLAGYEAVFKNDQIWNGYLNTIIYTVLGTIVNLVVTIPCAFALSRSEFKARRVIMFLFTVTMFFSGGLVPTYLLYQQLGILNSALVFILPGAISAYNVIVARTFFETSIPEELHDAAQIDGMSYFGYFFRIVIPLSSAIIYRQVASAERASADPDRQREQLAVGRFGVRSAADRRPAQVRDHHHLDPASAGALPVPAEVLQQGRHARRRQGLSMTRSGGSAVSRRTIRRNPAPHVVRCRVSAGGPGFRLNFYHRHRVIVDDSTG